MTGLPGFFDIGEPLQELSSKGDDLKPDGVLFFCGPFMLGRTHRRQAAV